MGGNGKSCCVVNCKNNEKNCAGRQPRVHFYSFPTDKHEWRREWRARWINAVKRRNPDGSNWEPKKGAVICSDHFVGGQRSKHPLHPAYIPTIFPHSGQSRTRPRNSKRFERCMRRQQVKDVSKHLQTNQPTESTSTHEGQRDTTFHQELEINGSPTSTVPQNSCEVNNFSPAMPSISAPKMMAKRRKALEALYEESDQGESSRGDDSETDNEIDSKSWYVLGIKAEPTIVLEESAEQWTAGTSEDNAEPPWKWDQQLGPCTKTPEEQPNLMSQAFFEPAVKGNALNSSTPLEAWSCLLSDDILEMIAKHTNEEIDRTRNESQSKRQKVDPSFHKHIDLVELKACIGLLYYAGVHKMSTSKTANWWSIHSVALFRATMARNRFAFLLHSLRFDDKSSRAENKKVDRFTHIRAIWDLFVANCSENYEPHSNCSIEEQLLPFPGRCSFKITNPSEPDKYCLRIISVNDALTHYTINAMPYLGPIDPDHESDDSYYIEKLGEPIHNTGRDIACHNLGLKGGPDAPHFKWHQYSVARKTFRWPMCVFYAMLDQANVNSFILYNINEINEQMKFNKFMIELSLGLVKPLLIRRLATPTMRLQLRNMIEEFLEPSDLRNDPETRDFSADNKLVKHKRCALCPSSLDRKTYYKCLHCHKAMCREHVAKICSDCILICAKYDNV